MIAVERIENLGVVNLEGVSVGDGQLEVHLPIENFSEQLDGIVDKCHEDYLEKHPEVKLDNISFDVRIVFSCGGFRDSMKCNDEFTLMVIVWSEYDNIDEFYEEIAVELSDEDLKKLRKIIWDGLGKMLFGI